MQDRGRLGADPVRRNPGKTLADSGPSHIPPREVCILVRQLATRKHYGTVEIVFAAGRIIKIRDHGSANCTGELRRRFGMGEEG